MLTWEGHIKLVDFGLSKDVEEIIRLNHSIVGTPGYVSPEICLRKGHNFLSDVYNIGIFLYDILHGYLPFDPAKQKGKTLEELRESHKNLKFKQNLSFEAKDLISKLLSINPDERLDGETDVLSMLFHPWFQGNSKYINSSLRPRPVHSPDLSKIHFDTALNEFKDLYAEDIESSASLPSR